MIKKFSEFVAYHPKLISAVAAVLLIPCVIGIAATRINYDILSYLPDDSDAVKGEKILDTVFGSAANAFLIVEDMPDKDIVAVKNKISGIAGVKNVIWTDSFGDSGIPASILPDAIGDIFLSSDGKSKLMMIQFDNSSASDGTMHAVENIKSVMNNQCFLSGMSVLLSDTKNIVESETPVYILVAVVLAVIALSLTMSSWLLPFILMISLGCAVIYNMGTNFIGGISYITQSIAAILQIGVTMDYSIFLNDRYEEELQKINDRPLAMSNAIEKTFFSIISSSLTTVFGFLSLCFMSFSLGLDIGLVMTKGVILGVITSLTVFPSVLLLFHNPVHALRHPRLIPDFIRISMFGVKHKKIVAVFFIILIAVSYILKSNVEVYYDFIKALPQDMTSVVSLEKLKKDFNMVTTHFVIIEDDISPYKAAETAEDFKSVDGVTSVLSLNSFLGPGIPYSMIPDSIAGISRKDGYELMMINSSYPSSSKEVNAQLEELDKVMKKNRIRGMITGEAALSKELITVTERDFRVTSAVSIIAIFIIIALSFKSIKIPIILVSSIELAIFINESISFLTGEDVSFIAPTVIGCVELGATVDYAILLTTRYKDGLMSGKSSFRAIRDAVKSSARSVFQSSLVFFCAAFGVYCVCNVMLIRNICLMLARGAIISAAVIMFILPALLSLIFNKATPERKLMINENQ